VFSEFHIYHCFVASFSAAFFRTVLEDVSSIQTLEIRHCHFQICTVLQFRVILDLFEVSLLFTFVELISQADEARPVSASLFLGGAIERCFLDSIFVRLLPGDDRVLNICVHAQIVFPFKRAFPNVNP
jgi:hypothetical protein